MDYYTVHSKQKDRPNQNLYNCRNSRILNSSEISDENEYNKTVKFISDAFKTITGGDPIYARELGTKNTTYFQAGKVLIQTNKMPTFTKLDVSLKERIIVIPFPYTFTDDKDKLKEDPSKYKQKNTLLKDKFKSELYRIALTNILLEYYKKYQKDFTIPLSIINYTKTYFNGESVQGFISSHCTIEEKSKIDLKELKPLINDATGKSMSIKSLKEELEELGYEIKKNKGEFVLKGYTFKTDEEEGGEEEGGEEEEEGVKG